MKWKRNWQNQLKIVVGLFSDSAMGGIFPKNIFFPPSVPPPQIISIVLESAQIWQFLA